MIFGGLKKDKLNSKRMLEMWSNFVKYLDPTPPSSAASEALAGVQWLPVTAESKQYLKIDEELTMEMTEEYQTRINFWKNATLAC